ncbi:neuronal acetylcholine receptor subunit alpha-10-like isoform X2 [Pomacea canaliculata]|uniref:neuronal acetylcholine receptor subunit alpha-10-like isoform X2 n=1 Tax=Pomacea canaliculata TaxID=400727 RepID=UPI000D7341ED|nr:neuronal acetylcholine receptor subunit alpha-10-like isoform X2 [Pomacea canaliculata]
MLLRRKWLSLLNPTQAFSLVLSTLVAHTMMPTLASADELQDLPDEQRLLAKLLHNYNSNVRPVINSSHSVEVVFGFSLIQIMDMDEKNQVLTINAWLESTWRDPRMQWRPEEYNNLRVFRLPSKFIWLPDIVLYNNADDYTNGFMPCNVMIFPDGTVSWPPPAKLRSSCQVDITYFPFDWQRCTLKFGSWSYDKAQVDLLNKTSVVEVTNYVTNGEWTLHKYDIIRNEVVYPISDAVYPDVTIVLVIQRRILYYVLNIMFPCFWLNILSVLTFCLPVDSGEKITLSITVLLSYSVFMLLVADTMPPTSEAVPLIVLYLTVSMSMSSLSVIVTVFVEKLHYCIPGQKKLPHWAKVLVLNWMARLVGCAYMQTWKRNRKTRSSTHAPEIMVTPSSATATFKRSDSAADPELSVKLLGDRLASATKHVLGNKTANNSSSSRATLSVLGDENLSLDVRSPSRKSSFNVGDWGPSCPSPDLRLANASPQRLSSGSESIRLSVYERASTGMEDLLRYLKAIVERAQGEDEMDVINNEWKHTAMVIDRFMFWIFMLITLVSTFVVVVLVPASKYQEETKGI